MQEIKDFKYPSIKSNNNDSILRVFDIDNIPFKVRRVFSVVSDKGKTRGKHAHKHCIQLLNCISGLIELKCFDGKGSKSFLLNDNNSVLIPSGIWAEQTYLEDKSALIVFCDQIYEEKDYIRNYDEFIAWKKSLQ